MGWKSYSGGETEEITKFCCRGNSRLAKVAVVRARGSVCPGCGYFSANTYTSEINRTFYTSEVGYL